jgi:hypothetical protein
MGVSNDKMDHSPEKRWPLNFIYHLAMKSSEWKWKTVKQECAGVAEGSVEMNHGKGTHRKRNLLLSK